MHLKTGAVEYNKKLCIHEIVILHFLVFLHVPGVCMKFFDNIGFVYLSIRMLMQPKITITCGQLFWIIYLYIDNKRNRIHAYIQCVENVAIEQTVLVARFEM